MTYLIAFLVFLFGSALIFPAAAQAVCPVCTVAVAAGVGLSRYLGIDDTISGVWMGALTISAGLWLVNWLESRRIRFPFRRPLIVIGFFLLTVWPLYSLDMIGHPLNTLWGIDKLLLGLIVGALLFILAAITDQILRARNQGKVYLPYQRVILPVSLLVIKSLVFYLITR